MEQDIADEFSDMVAVLKKINGNQNSEIDDDIIVQILALTIKHSLDSDRSKCQKQIHEIIKQKRW